MEAIVATRRIVDISQGLARSIYGHDLKRYYHAQEAHRSSYLTGFVIVRQTTVGRLAFYDLTCFALACSARYSYILNDDIRIAFLEFGRALAFSIVIYGSLGGWIDGIEDGLYKDSIYGSVLGRTTLSQIGLGRRKYARAWC